MLIKVLFVGLLCMILWHLLSSKNVAEAANPYLPLWEHIPDGEPRLFEDPDHPGKYRVYIYGSHDTRRTAYCGYDIPVWSAPVEDLTNWRFDGIAFRSVVNGKADILFAPDVVEVIEADGTKTYYLYPNNQSWGRNSQIAKSKRPDGPFEVCNWKPGSSTETEGILGFDPAVLVDDDGRVYGYWGFKRSFAAELDPTTMCTVKPGTSIVVDMIGNCDQTDGNDFRFFEASSIRKVKNKYVFVYSRVTKNGEYGLGPSNSTLAYAYADTPLGPWTYGGTIVDARGPMVGEHGRIIETQPCHNTHGSILEINGQWYIFYHRVINNDGYSRQAMVAPINVEVTADGKVIITGTNVIQDDFGNVYTGAEVTSEGFEVDGLNPYTYHSAGITSFLLGGPYVKATYDTWRNDAPVVNIHANSIVGYKYFNFSNYPAAEDNIQLEVYLTPSGVDALVEVMLDSPWESKGGVKLGSVSLTSEMGPQLTKFIFPVARKEQITGKHGIYLIFKSDASEVLCELNGLKFSASSIALPNPMEATLDDWDRQNLIPPAVTVLVDNTPVTEFTLSDHDYNTYHCTFVIPAAVTVIPQVTASCDDTSVVVTVQQAESLDGSAVVSLRKGEQVKKYYIDFQK